jgi:hypothetical protein
MNSSGQNKKRNPFLRVIIYIFSGLGAIFSAYLVIMETYNPGFCPKLIGIPACYPVLFCYMLVFVSLFIDKRSARYIIFYLGIFIGLAIGVWFSAGKISGTGICPELLGIPLCYASLILFVLILILGAIEIRKKKTG